MIATRIRYSVVLALVCATFLTQGSAQAQTGSQDPLSTPACPQIAWSCAQVTDLDEGKHGVGHRQQLRQTGLPATDPSGNPQQFIIACGMNTDRGFLATTGNKALDREYCLSTGEFDTLAYLESKYGYSLKMQGFTNPFTAPDGAIDKTVLPSNEGEARTHMCVIGWKLPITTTGSSTDPAENESTTDTFGLEYTTFTFAAGAAQCTTVYADPYGRTYNANLKPVPGADVSIYDADSKVLMNLFGLPNPVRTGIDGIFNFNLPPGRTYLQTSLTNLLQVHPNYTLAYTEPYRYGDVIVETLGNAEHRDIPVVGGGTPQLALTGYSHVRTGDRTLIQGSASWPLTLVDIMQESTAIASQQSTKFGTFEFRMDPVSIDPTQQLVVKLTEVDLTTNPTGPAANPATTSIELDPIPSYLEGYAYDADGKLLPFATVRIRLQLNDALYYQTSADKDAYYAVAPRNLPIMPYYLEIVASNTLPGGTTLPGGGVGGSTGTGGTDAAGNPLPSPAGGMGTSGAGGTTQAGTVAGAVRVTIPEYARQNSEYHAANNINIMAGTKNGIKVDPRAVADSSSAVFGDQGAVSQSGTDKIGAAEAAGQSPQQRYITLLILVVLLLFVGTGAVLMIRKKGRQGADNVYTKDTRGDVSGSSIAADETDEPNSPPGLPIT